MTDERNADNPETNTTPASAPPVSPSPPPVSPSPPAAEEVEEKSPPYGLVFAIVALAVAVGAYLLTMWLFRDLFREAKDAAIVTGALGALFTLVGTIAGTYFGVKRSSDTEDKGRAAERAANERAKEANESAKAALGSMDPEDWQRLKNQGLL